VLSRVRVTRDPAPTIEPHLYLEKLPVRVRASLQEGQVLTGQGVMKVLTSGHVAQSVARKRRTATAERTNPKRGIPPPVTRFRAMVSPRTTTALYATTRCSGATGERIRARN